MPGWTSGVVEVAPYAAVERTPELNPESYNDTNRMQLHVFANDEKAQAVLVAVYDNLGKGASGAAVQNMDLMLGLRGRLNMRSPDAGTQAMSIKGPSKSPSRRALDMTLALIA